METKTSMPSLLDLSSRPAINTSLWRAGFSGMGTSLPALVHRWATPAQSGKSWAWPKGWVAVAFFPFVLFPSYEEHPGVFSISAFLSSPFFKRLHLYCIYTVLPYEVCMNMCFSNSSKKRSPPFFHSQWSVCYVTPPKIDLDFSKVCSSQPCLPVSMHDSLRSYFQSLR